MQPYYAAVPPHALSSEQPEISNRIVSYVPIVVSESSRQSVPSSSRRPSKIKQNVAAVKIQRVVRKFLRRKQSQRLLQHLHGEFGLHVLDCFLNDFLVLDYLPSLIEDVLNPSTATTHKPLVDEDVDDVADHLLDYVLIEMIRHGVCENLGDFVLNFDLELDTFDVIFHTVIKEWVYEVSN
ncbi:hypothetical protein GEMRC1_007733 [Eukaryota sp. GEM-RC1]